MSISLRTHIHWCPDSHTTEASEPTTTLVLSTPARNYIDLRYYLSTNSQTERKHAPLDLRQAAWRLAARTPQSDADGFARLEWGFSGTSAREPSALGEDSERARFVHEVDSRTVSALEVCDEGVCSRACTEVEGGHSVEWELETGMMSNPELGGETMEYSEGWLDMLASPARPVVCLKCWDDGPDGGGQKVVAGCVIRVAGYVQGLLRTGREGFVTERWIMGAGGHWDLVASSKEGEVDEERHGMPCPIAANMENIDETTDARSKLELGHEVRWRGRVWKVIEIHW